MPKGKHRHTHAHTCHARNQTHMHANQRSAAWCCNGTNGSEAEMGLFQLLACPFHHHCFQVKSAILRGSNTHTTRWLFPKTRPTQGRDYINTPHSNLLKHVCCALHLTSERSSATATPFLLFLLLSLHVCSVPFRRTQRGQVCGGCRGAVPNNTNKTTTQTKQNKTNTQSVRQTHGIATTPHTLHETTARIKAPGSTSSNNPASHHAPSLPSTISLALFPSSR